MIEGSILVAVISVIGMILVSLVSWYLNYRSSRIRFEVETRAEYVQEVLRDNYKLLNYLRQITMRRETKGNVSKIQELMDNHPYNFKFDIINKWVGARHEFEKSDSIEKITKLMMDVMNRISLYEDRYSKILGIEEVSDNI